MNHGGDANVPIYLGRALLRLSFSPREGNAAFTGFLCLSSVPIPIREHVIKEDRYLEAGEHLWPAEDRD